MRRQDLPVCAFVLCKMNVVGGGGACDYMCPSLCVVSQTGCSVRQYYVFVGGPWVDIVVRFFAGTKIFCLLRSFHTDSWPAQWVSFSKWLSGGEVKNAWSYTSSPPYYYMTLELYQSRGKKLCFNLTENYRENILLILMCKIGPGLSFHSGIAETSALCIRCSYFSNLNDAA